LLSGFFYHANRKAVSTITLYGVATHKVVHGKGELGAYVDSWDSTSIVTADEDPDWEDIPNDELEEGENSPARAPFALLAMVE